MKKALLVMAIVAVVTAISVVAEEKAAPKAPAVAAPVAPAVAAPVVAPPAVVPVVPPVSVPAVLPPNPVRHSTIRPGAASVAPIPAPPIPPGSVNTNRWVE
jgi:hypothetical protein